MTKFEKKELIELLNKTFVENKARLEKFVWGKFKSTNSSGYAKDLAERGVMASYEYFLKALEGGTMAPLQDVQSERHMFFRLRKKALREALDMAKRRSGSKIVHDYLDAKHSVDGSMSNLDFMDTERAGSDRSSILNSLSNQEQIGRILENLSVEDQEFLEVVTGAQLDGNYARPPFKAIARQLDTTTHKVQYRWKKLQERIKAMGE